MFAICGILQLPLSLPLPPPHRQSAPFRNSSLSLCNGNLTQRRNRGMRSALTFFAKINRGCALTALCPRLRASVASCSANGDLGHSGTLCKVENSPPKKRLCVLHSHPGKSSIKQGQFVAPTLFFLALWKNKTVRAVNFLLDKQIF